MRYDRWNLKRNPVPCENGLFRPMFYRGNFARLTYMTNPQNEKEFVESLRGIKPLPTKQVKR